MTTENLRQMLCGTIGAHENFLEIGRLEPPFDADGGELDDGELVNLAHATIGALREAVVTYSGDIELIQAQLKAVELTET